MKITEVQAILMSCPLPEPCAAVLGRGANLLKRDAMLIRVTADNGLVGFTRPVRRTSGGTRNHDSIRSFPARQRSATLGKFDFRGELESPKPIARGNRAHDLAARYDGCALSELNRRRKRDRIKLYGSAGMYMSPARFAEKPRPLPEWDSLPTKCVPRWAGNDSKPCGSCEQRSGRTWLDD